MKTDLLTLTPAEFCNATKACKEGREFALQFASMHEVWANCPRLEWHFWILEKVKSPCDKQLRLFAVWCARNTPLANGKTIGSLLIDPRSIAALEVAERFANDNASEAELAAAESAAAWAAESAESAAWAAAWSAARAAAAESAAAAAAWSAARTARAAAWSAARTAAAARTAESAAAAAVRTAESAAAAAVRTAESAAAAVRTAESAAAAQLAQFKLMVENPFQ